MVDVWHGPTKKNTLGGWRVFEVKSGSYALRVSQLGSSFIYLFASISPSFCQHPYTILCVLTIFWLSPWCQVLQSRQGKNSWWPLKRQVYFRLSPLFSNISNTLIWVTSLLQISINSQSTANVGMVLADWVDADVWVKLDHYHLRVIDLELPSYTLLLPFHQHSVHHPNTILQVWQSFWLSPVIPVLQLQREELAQWKLHKCWRKKCIKGELQER